MKIRGENLLPALGLGLCALLLALSLLLDARTAICSDQCLRTAEAVRELRRENESLRVRCACSQSLDAVRRYAEEELGMQPLSAEQMRSVGSDG